MTSSRPHPQRVAFPLLFLVLALALGPRCEGGWANFENTGSLTEARSYHTATLLPNGKVLVAGGISANDNPNSLGTAELYDLATESWAPTGSLIQRRHRHSATLLPDGKVLVAGGREFFFEVASAELYDPGTGVWTETGNLANPRFDHTATLLTDGRVLLAAGAQEDRIGFGTFSTFAAELYDPASGTWTATGNLAHPRMGHTATLLPDGKVLVAGGRRVLSFNSSEVLASAELYDPATGTWSFTGSLTRVVVRALGPSIPVNGALANPTVELHDENGATIAFNDDWKTRPDGSSQQAEIEATHVPPSNDLESALVQGLLPGNDTAIVRGKDGATGIGLVEVYRPD